MEDCVKCPGWHWQAHVTIMITNPTTEATELQTSKFTTQALQLTANDNCNNCIFCHISYVCLTSATINLLMDMAAECSNTSWLVIWMRIRRSLNMPPNLRGSWAEESWLVIYVLHNYGSFTSLFYTYPHSLSSGTDNAINESINPSINQPIIQPTNQSTNQSAQLCTNHPFSSRATNATN